MSNAFVELTNHHEHYVALLAKVCSGLDDSVGNTKHPKFWEKFVDKLVMQYNARRCDNMADACARYLDILKPEYNYIKNPDKCDCDATREIVDRKGKKYKNQLRKIFGGRSTPPRGAILLARAPRSKETHSRSNTTVHSPGYLERRVERVLASLVPEILDFVEVGIVLPLLTTCEGQMQIFLDFPLDLLLNQIQMAFRNGRAQGSRTVEETVQETEEPYLG